MSSNFKDINIRKSSRDASQNPIFNHATTTASRQFAKASFSTSSSKAAKANSTTTSSRQNGEVGVSFSKQPVKPKSTTTAPSCQSANANLSTPSLKNAKASLTTTISTQSAKASSTTTASKLPKKVRPLLHPNKLPRKVQPLLHSNKLKREVQPLLHPKQTAKGSSTTIASKQTAKASSTTIASKQTAKASSTTTASKQTAKASSTTTASKQTAKRSSTTTAPKQTAKRSSTTTASKQTAKGSSTTTASQQGITGVLTKIAALDQKNYLKAHEITEKLNGLKGEIKNVNENENKTKNVNENENKSEKRKLNSQPNSGKEENEQKSTAIKLEKNEDVKSINSQFNRRQSLGKKDKRQLSKGKSNEHRTVSNSVGENLAKGTFEGNMYCNLKNIIREGKLVRESKKSNNNNIPNKRQEAVFNKKITVNKLEAVNFKQHKICTFDPPKHETGDIKFMASLEQTNKYNNANVNEDSGDIDSIEKKNVTSTSQVILEESDQEDSFLLYSNFDDTKYSDIEMVGRSPLGNIQIREDSGDEEIQQTDKNDKIQLKPNGDEMIQLIHDGHEKIQLTNDGDEKIQLIHDGDEKIPLTDGNEKILLTHNGDEKIQLIHDGDEKIQLTNDGDKEIQLKNNDQDMNVWKDTTSFLIHRDRQLIVDEKIALSHDELKAQLSDTSDTLSVIDLSPPTKKTMMWSDQRADNLFVAAGRANLSSSLLQMFPKEQMFHEFYRPNISVENGESEQRGMAESEDQSGMARVSICQLIVGNLPPNCTELDLRKLFSAFGKVTDLIIIENTSCGAQSKPGKEGVIIFDKAEDAIKALNAKPIMLFGNHCLNVQNGREDQEGINDCDLSPGGGEERGSQIASNPHPEVPLFHPQATTFKRKLDDIHIGSPDVKKPFLKGSPSNTAIRQFLVPGSGEGGVNMCRSQEDTVTNVEDINKNGKQKRLMISGLKEEVQHANCKQAGVMDQNSDLDGLGGFKCPDEAEGARGTVEGGRRSEGSEGIELEEHDAGGNTCEYMSDFTRKPPLHQPRSINEKMRKVYSVKKPKMKKKFRHLEQRPGTNERGELGKEDEYFSDESNIEPPATNHSLVTVNKARVFELGNEYIFRADDYVSYDDNAQFDLDMESPSSGRNLIAVDNERSTVLESLYNPCPDYFMEEDEGFIVESPPGPSRSLVTVNDERLSGRENVYDFDDDEPLHSEVEQDQLETIDADGMEDEDREASEKVKKQKSKFECSNCSCKFQSEMKLRNHYQQKHVPIPCTECEELLLRKSMARHMLKHFPEPLICPDCDTNFNRKDNLQAHMKKYHN